VGDKYARTPVYYAFELYRPHMGARLVPMTIDVPELSVELISGSGRLPGHQTAERRVVARAVREQEELVRGVKGDDVARPAARFAERLETAVGEHACDEVLAEARIPQITAAVCRKPAAAPSRLPAE